MTPVNPYAPPQFEASGKNDKKYDSIGGWLILVSIGLTVTTFANLVEVVRCFALLRADDGSLSMSFLICAMLESGALAIGALVGLVLMFRRSSMFPKFAIGLIVVSLLLSLGDLVFMGPDPDTNSDLVGSLARCAIWIPYFIRSKRVEKTFVN